MLDAHAIRHTVAFALRHEPDSDAERAFLEAAGKLAEIPGVERFELLREVSPKNDFRFGISMELADDAAYAAYNVHPDHVRFVEERWIPEVVDFLEIDYRRRP
jgi:heme-degrading monooxygenase HmoA